MLAGQLLMDGHCHIGEGARYRLLPAKLLAEMDELGIDRAVLVPADRHIAVDNSEGNDLILRVVEQYPDRFWGFATANPWYGWRAIAELRRAVRAGLIGLKLDPVLQGFLLCENLVYPLIEEAINLSIPIYVDTGTPVNALPLQLAELAQTYPEGRFIMGHTGNPDFWLDAPVALGQAGNLWAELSYNLPGVVNRLVGLGFARRLLFGSDAPLADLRLEVQKIQYWQVSQAERAAIMAGNLVSLVGQDGSR